MIQNRSMPPGTIIPELPYDDVLIAARWIRRTFGFKERLRIGNHRFQLTRGDSSIVVVERKAPGNSSLMVHVEDVDDHHEHVKACGARVISPPADYPFGERQYTVEDIGGHRWTFSESIADVDPKDWGGELF